jgi:hypothetical protein
VFVPQESALYLLYEVLSFSELGEVGLRPGFLYRLSPRFMQAEYKWDKAMKSLTVSVSKGTQRYRGSNRQ